MPAPSKPLWLPFNKGFRTGLPAVVETGVSVSFFFGVGGYTMAEHVRYVCEISASSWLKYAQIRAVQLLIACHGDH